MSTLPQGAIELMKVFETSKHKNMLSQKAQDLWINSIVRGARKGVFLDLAAADGLEHSNTYFFEKELDWKGILIEPNLEFFSKLKRNRTSLCINDVISDQYHEVDFRYDNGQLGGIVAEDTDNSKSVRGEQLAGGTIEKRFAKPLNDVLRAVNAPEYIDYFSLDVEGAEERVISSIDFGFYRFGFITIERPNPVVNETLFENGYKFVRNCRFDTFYAHADMIEKYDIVPEAFEQIPRKEW